MFRTRLLARVNEIDAQLVVLRQEEETKGEKYREKQIDRALNEETKVKKNDRQGKERKRIQLDGDKQIKKELERKKDK